ncbi:MAG: hypothetical protein EA364_12035 [Balneolaceae bacterium]|nr:MAG: hypothetical protein EA364_12035 [Balneolaceae bacterium]
MINTQGDFQLSRRDMLAVMAMIGAVPILHSIGTTWLGTVRMQRTSGKVAFSFRGKDRWVVDVRRFTGRPRLEITRLNKEITVSLRGAFFPGTLIPAGFTCRLQPTFSGWKMAMTTETGIDTTVSFERWLLGLTRLTGSLPHTLDLTHPSQQVSAQVPSGTSHSLTAGWMYTFGARKQIAVHLPESDFMADGIVVRPATDTDPSLMVRPPMRRTMVSVQAPDAHISIQTRPGTGKQGFAIAKSRFGQLDMELGESSRKSYRSAVMAMADVSSEPARIYPAPKLRDATGSAFILLASRLRYAAEYSEKGNHELLIASAAEQTHWTYSGDQGMMLGCSGFGEDMEFEMRGGELVRSSCKAQLLGTMLPPAGERVIAQPVYLAEPGIIDISFDKSSGRRSGRAGSAINHLNAPAHSNSPAPRNARSHPNLLRGGSANEVRISPVEENPPVLQIANPSVELIRPDDLVVMRFEFVNMAFRGEGPDRVITTTSGTPYLIVWHQPQNIGEEAFFESAPKLKLDDENPEDPDIGADDEKPDPPPVNARYSGPSRVVYKVPPGTTIPYNLDDLLAACGTFEMNVAPTALPPPVVQLQVATPGIIGAIDTITQRDAARVQQPTQIRGRAPATGARQTFVNAWPSKWELSDSRTADGEMNIEAESPAIRGAVGLIEGRKTVPPPTEQRVDATRMIRAQRNVSLSQYSAITTDIMQPATGIDRIDQLAPIPTILPPLPSPPDTIHTAIEAPYRLIISPNRLNGWAHRKDPGQSLKTGRIELWHSRLGMRRQDGSVNEHQRAGRTIRAIWYTDQKFPNADKSDFSKVPDHEHDPFRLSLDSFDRHNLVHLSSNFRLDNPNGGRYIPRPVDVNRLMLSSLGSWMNVRGAWDVLPDLLSVEEWLHQGTLGRDHYVKVVYAGNLFPFGHRASLVKITERKFEPHPTQPSLRVAYLRQRMFIIVREPIITQALGNTPDDRKMPFKSIQITTRSTPMLDDPAGSDYGERKQSLFWPRVGGKDFQFSLRLEDVEGGLHEVTMPLAFIGKEILDSEGKGESTPLPQLISDYNTGATPAEKPARRKRPFGGQMVAFAIAQTPGDTAFETANVEFNAVKKNNHPFFVPVLNEANVEAPAVSQLTGNALSLIRYSPVYLTNGFTSGANSANAGEIFLELPELQEFNVEGQGDKSGGLVQPNMKISAFSRKAGTVGGDSDTFAGGEFDPEKYFGGGDTMSNLKSEFSPKLFGVIDLWNILEAVGLDLPGKAPRFVTEALNVIEKLINDAARLKQIANELPGASLGALNNVRTAVDNVLDSFQVAISDPGSFSAATIQNHLTTLDGHLATLENQLLTATGIKESMRREGMYIVSAVRHVIDAPAKILKIIEEVQNFIQAIEMAREMRVRLEWKPDIKAWPVDDDNEEDDSKAIFVPRNKDGTAGSFVLAVELNANQGSSNGSGGQSFEVLCCLDNFSINLIGPATTFVKVYFNKMGFSVRTGKKPAIDIDFGGLEFAGPLSFVERLRAIIPLDGFSDPPYVKVDVGGIEAGFTFEVPSVGMGIMTLQNIVLGAKVNIPFIGDPLSISFFFNTREKPCTLTVYGIGGGVFVGIAVNMQGLQIVEASIEFGGSISFNVAVASGGVYIMAGIYFKMEKIGDVTEITLTGYLRLGGHVSVLKLISISIELRMELSYVGQVGGAGKVVGKASLEIKIKIVFFSIGVTITVERKLAGSNNDPTFLDAMGHPYMDPVLLEQVDPWEQYCIAYAN